MAQRAPSPAKEFEIAVSKIMEGIGAKIDSQGACYGYRGGARVMLYCPDILGKYRGYSFVADCKLYGETKYLDPKKDCKKLVRDMNESGARVGIMVLSGGRVSQKTRDQLKADGVFLIEVKPQYKKPYWITNFTKEFEDCFSNLH